jgi:KRAB domain-containing zinc finger protein
MSLSREQIQLMKSRLNKVSSEKDFNTFINIWVPMNPSLKNDLFDQLFLLDKGNTFNSRLEAMHNVVDKYSEDLLNKPSHSPPNISTLSRNFTKKLQKMATQYRPTTSQKGSGPLHQCSHCPYNTINTGNLTRHNRKHTGEKPFKCSHCSYSSVTSDNLTKHNRLHTGEKPFQCTLCPFKSSHAQSLKGHVEKHVANSLLDLHRGSSCNLEKHQEGGSITKKLSKLVGLDSNDKYLSKMIRQSQSVSSDYEIEQFLLFWNKYFPNLLSDYDELLSKSNDDDSQKDLWHDNNRIKALKTLLKSYENHNVTQDFFKKNFK